MFIWKLSFLQHLKLGSIIVMGTQFLELKVMVLNFHPKAQLDETLQPSSLSMDKGTE